MIKQLECDICCEKKRILVSPKRWSLKLPNCHYYCEDCWKKIYLTTGILLCPTCRFDCTMLYERDYLKIPQKPDIILDSFDIEVYSSPALAQTTFFDTFINLGITERIYALNKDRFYFVFLSFATLFITDTDRSIFLLIFGADGLFQCFKMISPDENRSHNLREIIRMDNILSENTPKKKQFYHKKRSNFPKQKRIRSSRRRFYHRNNY